MSKRVFLSRSELVWETRDVSWDEKEYENYLNWLKGQNDKYKDDSEQNLSYWYRAQRDAYAVLKNMTWDDIVAEIEKDDSCNEDYAPTYIIFKNADGTEMYRETVIEYIRDAIREDVYDADISGYDYADDYDETWDIQEYEDDPKGDA